jgi:hypothetical protein
LAYIPAERPVFGREAYKKLLPWQEHCSLMRAVVRTGVPVIAYGIIIGLPDDDHDDLQRLEEAISELVDELTTINPSVEFQIACYSIAPLPGTPTCNTHHLSYEQISEWQVRLSKIRRSTKEFTNYNGEYSGLVGSTSYKESSTATPLKI